MERRANEDTCFEKAVHATPVALRFRSGQALTNLKIQKAQSAMGLAVGESRRVELSKDSKGKDWHVKKPTFRTVAL